MNQATNEHLLQAKIQVLLRDERGGNARSRHPNEQRLVALVLLTRVDDDAFFRNFVVQQHLWMIHLLRVDVGWSEEEHVQQQHRSLPSTCRPSCSLVRLVGQVLLRALYLSSPSHNSPHFEAVAPDPHPAATLVAIHAIGDAMASTLASSSWGLSLHSGRFLHDVQMVSAELELVSCISAFLDWSHQQQERQYNEVSSRIEAISRQLWTAINVAPAGVDSTNKDMSAAATTSTSNDAARDSMEQTIIALLDHTTSTTTSSSALSPTAATISNLNALLHSAWMRLWVDSGRCLSSLSRTSAADSTGGTPPRLCLPRFVSTVLREWSASSSLSLRAGVEASHNRQWQAEALLAMLLGCAQPCQEKQQQLQSKPQFSNKRNAKSRTATAKPPDVNDGADTDYDDDALVVRLLLACVAFNQDDTDSITSERLRTRAWMCACTLLNAQGCAWLFSCRRLATGTTGTSHKNHGCAFIRLAVGEYRIQLSQVLLNNGPMDMDTNDESTALSVQLLEACGDMIMQTIQYLVQMADEMERESQSWDRSWTGDDFLHARRSLEEALNVTVQYLGLRVHDHDRVDSIAIQIFGALLMDFDAFDHSVVVDSAESSSTSGDVVWSKHGSHMGPPHDTRPEESSSEHTMLLALSRALQIATEASRRDSAISTAMIEGLLPSLATTFILAEGDNTRCRLLDEYQILGAVLMTFLQAYFDTTSSSAIVSTTPWASQIVELWASVKVPYQPTREEARRLQASLIAFMKRMLRVKHTVELAQALSTTVGAFIALQGSGEPSVPDMLVIKDVLTFCDLR